MSRKEVTNYKSRMHNIAEERRSHLNLGGSFKSRIDLSNLLQTAAASPPAEVEGSEVQFDEVW